MQQATKPAILYLQDFISQSPKLRDGAIIYKTGGICPDTGTLDKIVDDGVMLVYVRGSREVGVSTAKIDLTRANTIVLLRTFNQTIITDITKVKQK